MSPKLVALGMLLVAVLAAGALALGPTIQTESLAAIHDDGIGPLVVHRDFEEARRAAFRSSPESASAGLGCGGLAEIRYGIQLDDRPVGVMAMAESGQIKEIEATLYSPLTTENREACLALRDTFAKPFTDRFGPFQQTWEVNKPVSEELLARTGPVVVAARWFKMGNSCYVSAHYGVLESGSVRLGESLAALADRD